MTRRRLLLIAFALVAADLLVRGFADTWDRHSPDDYAVRVGRCAERPRDTVFIGGSPVAEGIDPDRFAGDNFAVGLSGGTTTDFYYATTHACPTPPKLLVYGITASDLNDSRNEPHGAWSLMAAADVGEVVSLRPDARTWVIRQYLRGKLSHLSATYHYRHGVRMWATQWTGTGPTAEADELKEYADALRDGRGYAPAKGFADQRYDAVKEANGVLPPFAFLNRYRTGSHVVYLHKLIDWAEARGTPLVLVDMPVTADLEVQYPEAFAEYRRVLAGVARTRRVPVIHAHRDIVGINDAGFADTIHLNRAGARVLSDWLSNRLETHPRATDYTDPPPLAKPAPAPVVAAAPAPPPVPYMEKPHGGSFFTKSFLVFLPVTLVGYHLLRGRTPKYTFLLAASWVFYALASPRYLWVLLLLTVVDYAVGRMLAREGDDRRRKRWLVVSVVANLSLLAAFKYAPFAWDGGSDLLRLCGYTVPPRAWDILLPLGISFHTFQGISYTVDVYRRRIPAVRSFLDYALFVAFFPQMAAGPIVRAAEFLPQMVTPPRVTAGHVADGCHLFAVGLFKKLILADQLDHLFVGPVFADPTAFTPSAQRWAAVAWAVQIYCDFSGYSDMATGIAKWFGFAFPQNFDAPYLATSPTDFWRRWHMSLSTWLRDYLYFPLGGSRGSAGRTYFNLVLLFVLCGLWHGATWAWLAYGLLFGMGIALHRAFDQAVTGRPTWDRVRATVGWKLFAWVGTMLQLLAGLILIRTHSWADCGRMLQSLVGAGDGGAGGVPPLVPVLMACGCAGHVAEAFRGFVGWALPTSSSHAETENGGQCPPYEILHAALLAALVVAVVVFAPGVGKTFIYIQF